MQNRRDYPDNWNDEIRPNILKRDNYKCVECSIKHRSYVLITDSNQRIKIEYDEFLEYKKAGKNCYKIYLQVSHINNIKADCSPENLRTLCNRCHAKADKEWKSLMRISAPVEKKHACQFGNDCPAKWVDHWHSESGVVIMF
jgi:5-methylcytosine-specific restriction endonuclease McrA